MTASFLMGWPEKQAVIGPLALGDPPGAAKIRHVEMLGFKGKLSWKQDQTGLTVQMPAQKPCEHAVALKVTASLSSPQHAEACATASERELHP